MDTDGADDTEGRDASNVGFTFQEAKKLPGR
jgi:hypothetical protein